MKVLITVISIFLSFNAYADKSQDAAKAYSLRGYDAAGMAQAQKAASLYSELVTETSDQDKKNEYLVLQSEAMYFVGSAYNESTENEKKLDSHLKAADVADNVLKAMGVTDATVLLDDAKMNDLKAKLNPKQQDIFAEALYYKGINLGQWGSAKGGLDSLSGWKKQLRPYMEVLEKMGKASIHNYGPYRTLGRGYYKVPSILGGDLKKSESYLDEAVKSSLVKKADGSTSVLSVNGYNNLYYAETLYKNGKKEEAKNILKEFVQTDLSLLANESIPENAKAKELAQEDLNKW